MSAPRRIRIDKLLVERGLVPSRERAQALVLAGAVYCGTEPVRKPGTLLPEDADLELRGTDCPFVSRGGIKLAHALDVFHIDVVGRAAVDVGASTGGFTDCLLQRGALRVYAIDVGYGQLAWKLRTDPRVRFFERTNIRHFSAERLPERVGLAVIDVSFISLRLVLPAVRPLLLPGAEVLPLVKPQFEVGKGQVGSGGVVRDPELRERAVAEIRAFAEASGFLCHGVCPSPITGPKGNVEYFLHLSLPL
jgi:23S rRNA (cytidine1920-2'-O)/16S rRNA (cytidine1409-2'-O)-methyltransferase